MKARPLQAARFAPLVSLLNALMKKDFIDMAHLCKKSNVNTLPH
jgi:hypothetical protein